MNNPIRAVIRQATRRKSSRINVLTFSVHESVQSNQSKCNADFYCMQGGPYKKWNEAFRKLPENFTLINEDHPPKNVEFDLVLSQNKHAHWKHAHQMSRMLNIPLINLEHCLPPPGAPPQYFQQYQSMRADLNLFISEFNRDVWGYKDAPNTKVIRHGVNAELFNPGYSSPSRNNTVLTVANDYINRDYCLNFSLYKHVTQGLPTTPVGATPGFSEAAKSTDDLVRFYQSSRIFLNTASFSPIPCSLLEAASCGCAIVSTQNEFVPKIFTHGHDSLLTDDPKEMRSFLELLLQNPEMAAKLGSNARETILKKCSLTRFVESWNCIFEELLQESFVP